MGSVPTSTMPRVHRKSPEGVWTKFSKMLNALGFLAFLWSLEGCASGQRASETERKLSHLQAENQRLSRELGSLRERLSVQKPEPTLCSASTTPRYRDPDPPTTPSPAGRNDAPTDVLKGRLLPIVKLSPQATEHRADGISIRESEPEPEADEPAGTRPVLKVHGQHEAWVYHRTVEGPEPTGIEVASGDDPVVTAPATPTER